MKKRITYLLSCILAFASFLSYAQEQKKIETTATIDSLLRILRTFPAPSAEVKLIAGIDTTQINTLNNLCLEFTQINNFTQGLQYANQAGQQAQKVNYKKGLARSYILIGYIYENKGSYEKAIENYLRSLKIYMELGIKGGQADCYKNVGVIYALQRNSEKAMYHYLKSLKIYEELREQESIAHTYNNIGAIYQNEKENEKALMNFLRSLKIYMELGIKGGEADCYCNIGSVYEELREHSIALDNYFKSLSIRNEIDDKYGIAISYISIGSVYMKQNKFAKSEYFLKNAMAISEKTGYKGMTMEAYFPLSELFEKQGDYKQAYQYYKLYSDLKDTLLNQQSGKIAEINAKYEKEKDQEIFAKDKALQEAETAKQKFIRNVIIAGLILALLLAFVLYNRFKVTNKQKKIIELQNFQIVESINYSKKIQNSLLPDIKDMQKSITNLFVFYEPKDIVSGDFYYFREFEKYTLLACVDCTGHGVPGGFMSTLGSLLLDKIVNAELLSPSEILIQLSNEIIRVLHQQDGGEIQDGMDLSICLINHENKKIEFSGARNGIIIISDEHATRYKADLLPVGGNYMKKGLPIERNFKTQTISINPNDWVYMYTDGFLEQIGGEAGIPMNQKQFENKLIAASKQQSSEEKNKLLQMEIDNWRGKYERDDDILIMGFQII